jgi:biotin operon repressor
VKRCASCRKAGKQWRADDAWLLVRFDRHAFRALLEHEGDWSLRDLAYASGIRVPTLHQWLIGLRRPRLAEWNKVAAALALDPCRHCAGSGTVDPTQANIAAITNAVQRRNLAVLPEPEPPITGDGWTLDRNSLALAIGHAQLRVTRQESRLIAVLASAAGGFIITAQLAALLKISNHAIHTYVTRLRDKCAAAGADLGQVIQNGHGAGYRAVMANREEAAS